MSTNFELLVYHISPSHSYIVDLSDGTWKDKMEKEDFEEISSCYDNALNKALPNHLKEILGKLNKQVKFKKLHVNA